MNTDLLYIWSLGLLIFAIFELWKLNSRCLIFCSNKLLGNFLYKWTFGNLSKLNVVVSSVDIKISYQKFSCLEEQLSKRSVIPRSSVCCQKFSCTEKYLSRWSDGHKIRHWTSCIESSNIKKFSHPKIIFRGVQLSKIVQNVSYPVKCSKVQMYKSNLSERPDI